MSKDTDGQVIPDIIFDSHTKINYKKGKFYGKGGFAKCYELINTINNHAYAGKIVSKQILTKENQKDKMRQEIEIHQSLRHKNVVGFYNFFDDNHNIYIVLELCRKKSMMELQKRRKVLSEPETRFYMRQILSGVLYLHQNRIIHRDLKLGNLFLNDELLVKIGDFGLAAKIEYDGERKKTLCGTPNYIAPEILNKKGHSFEVDVWSIGCIMYTLLSGRPPFETTSLKETYSKIRKCEYRFTGSISPSAQHMIMLMLQSEPKSRPKVEELLREEFIVNGYCPSSLPVSALTMAPRFDKVETPSMRKPLIQLNGDPMNVDPPARNYVSPASVPKCEKYYSVFDSKNNFLELRSMLQPVIQTKPKFIGEFSEEMSDPAAQPMIWVSKWVDYSDKYGFGYQLSDECVGVMFNDTTKLILLPNGINVHYVDKNGEESYMTIESYTKPFEKKMKLLSYFNRYMREHLLKTGASVIKENDSISRTPHLHQWCRSTSGVLMQLNNGTVQMNFGDHTKIIMCPLMGAVTYIDEARSFRTFRFESIVKHGCTAALYDKLKYAYDKLSILLDANNDA